MTKLCESCGREFELAVELRQFAKCIRHCPECSSLFTAKAEAEEKQRIATQIRERQKKEWEAICPLIYRETNIEQLPSRARELLPQILKWRYGGQGLLLKGATAAGKTRTAYLLLRRLFEEGRQIKALDALAYGHQCQTASFGGDGEQWATHLARVEVLFFDDFGKLKLTDRAESELFGLLERRTANGLPIIATTNATGDTLIARMTPDRGEPLVRRLREFCQTMTL